MRNKQFRIYQRAIVEQVFKGVGRSGATYRTMKTTKSTPTSVETCEGTESVSV